MRRFFFALVLAVFTAQSVWAQALPVSGMQNAVSGVMQAKMKARGFAANDPRFLGTLQGATGSFVTAATTAAVVTVAGATAPAWVTAGLAVGLSAVLAYGVNLALDATVHWLMNSDGSVVAGGSSSSSSGAAMSAGGPYYSLGSFSCGAAMDCATAELARQDMAGWPLTQTTTDASAVWFAYDNPAGNQGYAHWGYLSVSIHASGAPASCPGGQVYTGTACSASGAVSAPPAAAPSVAAAAAAVSPSDGAKPLNPQIVAVLADNAWKQAAAQPSYSGLPYDALNPISTADAAAWQAANPASWPTVAAVVSPQPTPQGGTAASPFQLPSSPTPVSSADPSAAPSPGTNPSTQPLSNLGPDPGVGAPTLESTPTAQAILSPVLGVMPSLKNFVVPSHGASCPKPSFTVFGTTFVMDSQCVIAETVRPSLYAVMAFVWLAMGVFIVLRA